MNDALEILVFIDLEYVSCPKPSIHKIRRVGFGVIPVSHNNILSAKPKLARLIPISFRSIITNNPSFHAGKQDSRGVYIFFTSPIQFSRLRLEQGAAGLPEYFRLCKSALKHLAYTLRQAISWKE